MEPERFETEESGENPLIERAGYPFYRKPLSIPADELASLASTLSDPTTYQTFSGEKKCGGFHPDHAVEWPGDSGASTRTILLCFGCGEAKILGPQANSALTSIEQHETRSANGWWSTGGTGPSRIERASRISGEDLADHRARHVGQAEIAARIAVGQLFVVEAEQVEDRGVEVVDGHAAIDGLEAEVIGRAVDVA